MTYCLGWRTQACAYLVADTAVTSPRPLRALRSSFGEQHVSGATGNVEEGALKIISARGAGITFSGNAAIGRDVADTFRMASEAGLAPRRALQTAITSSISAGDRVDLCVLCAFMEDNEPHLLSFNRDGDQRFIEHAQGDVVQLGSLVGRRNVVCQLSAAFIGQLKNTDFEGPALLACALGLCQSYGIHNVLLDLGVGGAFVGALIDAAGFHWQPDTAYLLFAPGKSDLLEQDGVFPLVRDDVLVIRSLLADGPPRVIMNSLGEPLEVALKHAGNVDRQCLVMLGKLQFDYLIFLNTAVPIIAVVEMGRRFEHRHVIVHPSLPPSAEGRGHIPMSIGAPLYFLMNTTSYSIDGHKSEPDVMLGALLHYMNYQHPCFDIRHVRFDVKFFDDDGGDLRWRLVGVT